MVRPALVSVYQGTQNLQAQGYVNHRHSLIQLQPILVTVAVLVQNAMLRAATSMAECARLALLIEWKHFTPLMRSVAEIPHSVAPTRRRSI